MYTTQQTQSVMDTIITEHNTIDNAIIQHFGDRSVRIVTDKATSKTGVFVNEDIVIVLKNLTITELQAVQQAAFLIWLSLQQQV
ncbi:MAG: hypothetical protein VB066_01900 [Paludibacter sp.]|nr:hypothetical protein [Paludibacter sp.]